GDVHFFWASGWLWGIREFDRLRFLLRFRRLLLVHRLARITNLLCDTLVVLFDLLAMCGTSSSTLCSFSFYLVLLLLLLDASLMCSLELFWVMSVEPMLGRIGNVFLFFGSPGLFVHWAEGICNRGRGRCCPGFCCVPVLCSGFFCGEGCVTNALRSKFDLVLRPLASARFCCLLLGCVGLPFNAFAQ